jgi:aflatoxin B1 aldehyde reductase
MWLLRLRRPLQQNYRNRYWNDAYFQALASIEVVAQKHNLTLGEVALRWISHHSLLKREYGDAVIIGASSLNHIEQVCLLFSLMFDI